MSRKKSLEAELEQLELEEELNHLRGLKRRDSDREREVKAKLSLARAKAREGTRGTVNPETINAETEVS